MISSFWMAWNLKIRNGGRWVVRRKTENELNRFKKVLRKDGDALISRSQRQSHFVAGSHEIKQKHYSRQEPSERRDAVLSEPAALWGPEGFLAASSSSSSSSSVVHHHRSALNRSPGQLPRIWPSIFFFPRVKRWNAPVRRCSRAPSPAAASAGSAASWTRPRPRGRGSATRSAARTGTCWTGRWAQTPGRTCCSATRRSRRTGSTDTDRPPCPGRRQSRN